MKVLDVGIFTKKKKLTLTKVDLIKISEFLYFGNPKSGIFELEDYET